MFRESLFQIKCEERCLLSDLVLNMHILISTSVQNLGFFSFFINFSFIRVWYTILPIAFVFLFSNLLPFSLPVTTQLSAVILGLACVLLH